MPLTANPLPEAELPWIIASIGRHVSHLTVNRAFIEELWDSATPALLIDPTDQAYGQEVVDAFLVALDTRIAARARLALKIEIQKVAPGLNALIEALEEQGLGPKLTKLILNGKEYIV